MARVEDKEPKKDHEAGKALRIKWVVPEAIDPQYVTNMVVQHTAHEFIVSFFRAQPPLILGTPDERKKALEDIDDVEATCVAQIVVAPKRLEDFIDVLQTNLKNYKAKAE